MTELIVMRLANMHRVHPDQDNSRICSKCGEQVGIYPSGQNALKLDSNLQIICEICFANGPTYKNVMTSLAPGAIQEKKESKPK